MFSLSPCKFKSKNYLLGKLLSEKTRNSYRKATEIGRSAAGFDSSYYFYTAEVCCSLPPVFAHFGFPFTF
ncbi:MAG: hypothetical protein C4530_08630 [Desulfobacteraceae bacterium]|nr:MAG: hypothetical protein C4530_08630 [Desulfobacteraceae bacterium]